MKELLFLVHRIPYPPNKGDKIRSFHILKHLARSWRVHLGAFIDAPEDWHYREQLQALCGETYFAALRPWPARLHCLVGLADGAPLSVAYYRDAAFKRWVTGMLARRPITQILVYSGAMAQFVMDRRGDVRRVIDFVDVDSDKWAQYAASKPWPISWLYRREARTLLTYERRIATEFDAACFVSAPEAALFRRLAPESAARVTDIPNGVDTVYFDPARDYPNPYVPGAQVLVFTGAMDYWANVEAVIWFAREVFPRVRVQHPQVCFYVVGARPDQSVQELASIPGVTVTGAVPDVRPYLAHARAAVAPLRIARGIQNKVLEAMAMARPVVVTPQTLDGIQAVAGEELRVAEDAVAYAHELDRLLQDKNDGMGRRARARVVSDYGWERHLRRLDALLEQNAAGIAASITVAGNGT